MSDHQNITGIVARIFMHNNNFMIAQIKESNHHTHTCFVFKGVAELKTPVQGDHVLISKGVFIESHYGLQLEQGCLSIIDASSKHTKNNIGLAIEKAPNAPPKQPLVLTEEQNRCILGARSGEDIKIKAYAGTGKTATLVEISKHLTGKGLYLAYNKAIQIDASAKFPAHVDCKTAHSIAYGYNYSQIHGRVETLTPLTILSYGNIKAQNNCQPYELAFLIIKALRLFCNTANVRLEASLLNHPDFSVIENNQEALNYVAEQAWAYWELARKPDAFAPIEHDFYLKWYQLSRPNLQRRYQYILFDECQDANPVITDILLKQSCQKICVGDEHQQIYGWRGAVNAYEAFQGQSYYLSQSFRFGHEIATLANIILMLKGETTILKGNPAIASRWVATKPTKYTNLCRTNAGLIERIIDNITKKLHVVGGTGEMLNLAKSGFALYQGDTETIRHNKIRGFKDWEALKNFNQDFEDPDIAFLVNIIERYRQHFGDVIHQIENAHYVPEPAADIIFSTIHKAKGREWSHLVVGEDFTLFEKEKGIADLLREFPEEFNLLYVAVTRAKSQLHLEKSAFRFIKRLQSYQKPMKYPLTSPE